MDKIISAGGIICRLQEGVPYIVVVGDRYGKLSFPKGRQDPGETLEETAMREVTEETGVHGLTIIQKLGMVAYRSQNPEQSAYPKEMHIFLMTGTELRQAEQFDEDSEPHWIPLREAMKVLYLEEARAILQRHETLLLDYLSELA